jgi:glycosyltransferase involved in cell wall biosynthesis
MNPHAIHLVLFLSRATPLQRWHRLGLLERETALYRRLSEQVGRVTLLTSGGPEELLYQEALGKIHILYNRWGLSPNAYSLLAPFLHGRALRQATVYKTNQMDGAWTAVLAGKLHRRPVITRAGYLWADNFQKENGAGLKSAVITQLEKRAVRAATAVAVTTPAMKQFLAAHYAIDPARITVVPNYVDSDRFRPLPDVPAIPGRVCFIGRLHPTKNIHLLIEAMSNLPDAALVMIGQGEQRQELADLAQRCDVNAQFLGVLPHSQLPTEINRAQVFVLPSRFEGHPKALLEAMACGTAVIGTDVNGIRDVIRHEATGLLCPPTVEGITAALRRLLADEPLRGRLGQAAREFVERHYSLNHIVEVELALLRQVAQA